MELCVPMMDYTIRETVKLSEKAIKDNLTKKTLFFTSSGQCLCSDQGRRISNQHFIRQTLLLHVSKCFPKTRKCNAGEKVKKYID